MYMNERWWAKGKLTGGTNRVKKKFKKNVTLL